MTISPFPTLRTPDGARAPGQPAWNRQRASRMPSHRYQDVFSRVDVPLTDRRWPTRRLTAAPLWVPVDLRDGNQALTEPMDPARKRRFFELLVAMGYTEIEVGYPSASQTDFDFVRLLAETDLAPEHVTIVVFTAARADLIARTFESVRGLRNPVVVHLYTATAPTWRDVVLGKGRAELSDLIAAAGTEVLQHAGDDPRVRFEFSPEVFNLTEPDYVLEVCARMTTLWDATTERPVILNLPATVEVATPNVYADQIEYMHRHLDRRDAVILSVHPHNDRGTGVACAELAVLAGAQRVEGCLFGNGERTGNVDLVTLGLNLHAQGVDPMIDFSDIDEIRRTVVDCNGIGVHERHPYAGDLVHTAYSGTHQDAIRKGFARHRADARAAGVDPADAPWTVPYLPVDPADVGRSYDAVVRVNSQSGKGGIAYLLESAYGLELPRRLQIDFARRVQAHADRSGGEVTAEGLWRLFEAAYVLPDDGARQVLPLAWSVAQPEADGDRERLDVVLSLDGERVERSATGAGPVDALTRVLAGLGVPVEVLGLTQQSVTSGADAGAVTYLEHRAADGSVAWAVGRDESVLGASVRAVLRAAASRPRATAAARHDPALAAADGA
ncbi:2-isopropylmalate synthase [Oerskovia gallyi]|uniref:2-isopropylmalate synthase n=1 Tax=Oerskovia gallyi TaxID=2762226 RepID=A0ABR8V2N5_9CELL|nr:2-isopropylmalate synthase [Oerskovia gallyi]MBD7999055.1 2-isopropylmalate synthase [Oerskovia gallyi]